eukprot:gene3154-13166_t
MVLDDNLMDHESRTLLAQAAYTRDQAFQLHSKPGSSKVIYLDFDGQVVTDSRWTRDYLNQDVSSITCAPYDIDGNSNNFGNAELDRILEIWKAVAEDFAPWDVDVTTQDPGAGALMRSPSSDQNYGVRVIFGQCPEIQNQCGCGGIAYLQCFADTADLPVFVFNTGIDGASEAASHEVGHALGLSHDGSASSSYYGGHGSGDNSWGPIMGASYGVSISQWSKDHGSTLASATLLPPETTGSVSVATTGIISSTGEKDYFRVNHGGGLVSVALTGSRYKSNLNAAVNLLDSNGNILRESNRNNSPKAGAVILSSNQPAGAYYISVSGHGVLDPSSGYTDYASLGQYWMDVNFISAPACNNNGVCDGGESNANCAKDCPCNLNGVCDNGESFGLCPKEFPPPPACNNNGVCDGGESNANCAKDCPCNLNGVCDNGESFGLCPKECPPPPACNNNGVCDGGESNANCAKDCPCNLNGVCDNGESYRLCPKECPPPPACNNNGVCEVGESNANCARDCPCNLNGVCDSGESFLLCPVECICNGNGICDSVETFLLCPNECFHDGGLDNRGNGNNNNKDKDDKKDQGNNSNNNKGSKGGIGIGISVGLGRWG